MPTLVKNSKYKDINTSKKGSSNKKAWAIDRAKVSKSEPFEKGPKLVKKTIGKEVKVKSKKPKTKGKESFAAVDKPVGVKQGKPKKVVSKGLGTTGNNVVPVKKGEDPLF